MKKLTLASLLSVGSFLAAAPMAQQAAPSADSVICSTRHGRRRTGNGI